MAGGPSRAGKGEDTEMRIGRFFQTIGAGALALAMAWPAQGQAAPGQSAKPASRLVPPAKGHIPVAFVLTEGAVMIDFAGPWEVFQDVMIESRGPEMADMHVFELYTVSDTRTPIQTSGGMQVIPDYTFDDAPAPRVVVIPAQGGKSPKMLDWIRRMTKQSDVVMSVCTGAFKLAAAGVLDGKKATTHHGSYDRLQRDFPRVLVQRGMRYVQSDPVIFTAGGLSSGIDLALHVVELYFGRGAAETTAKYMEYEGRGWMGDGTATANLSTPAR
ncbi:MAG: DJ-1/PfpI family protein [Acidobacteriota bacterium]